MRFTRFVVVMIVAGSVCAPAAYALQDVQNAATHYQRAMERLGELSEREWTLLWEYEGPAIAPTPELRIALRKAQPIISDFHRGSLQQYADYGLDLSEGFNLMIPHLGEMRQIALLTKTDINVRLYDGDTSGAADRLAALGRSLGHYRDDRLLLSSLVGQAVFSLTDGIIQTGFDRAAFDAADAVKILQPLEQLAESNDPFGHVESIVSEQEWMVTSITNHFREGEMGSVLGLLYSGGEGDEIDPRWATITEDELALHSAALDEFVTQAVDIVAMEDTDAAIAAMKTLEESFVDSEFNLLADFLPAYSKVLESRKRAEEMLDARLQSLRALVEGDAEPQQLANAATWYLRGIAELDQADAEALVALRELNLTWDVELPEPVQIFLENEGGRIIEQFQAGAAVRRCDFSIARQSEAYPLMPRYAPGMRDAFRVLHADAIRRMQTGDADAAADRLALCYHVIGHLSGDYQILSAMVAHAAFKRTHALAETGLASGHLTGLHRDALSSAFDRVGRADAFGYAAAVQGTRTRGVERAQLYGQHFPDAKEHFERLVDIIRDASGEKLLAMLAVGEAYSEHQNRKLIESGYPTTDQTERRVAVDALNDLLPLEKLAALRSEADALIARLVAGGFDGDLEPDLPELADIAALRTQAREALRAAIALLQPPSLPTE